MNIRNIKEKIKYSLNNENGSLTIQYIVVISASLCVGAGLFIIGKSVKDWFKNKPTPIIESMPLAGKGDNTFKWQSQS